MQTSDIPGRIPLPFADSGGKTTIPVTTASPGRASYTDGFPAVTRTPIASGGIPPDGTDMNGILNITSAWDRWTAAGGPVTWNSTFSTAVGGYPRASLLTNTSLNNMWFSLVNDNTVDPDSTGTGWTNVFPTSTSITATATLSVRQKGTVLVDATAGNITITIPGGSSTLAQPIQYTFIRTDATANAVTIVRAGSNTIEGLTSIVLAVGQRLTLNSAGGSDWKVIASSGGGNIQAFTSSGTFVVPSGVSRIQCSVWGGGGGGGGVGAGGGAAAGGAGAGYSEGWFTVTPGQSLTVTVGAGGALGNGTPTAGSAGATSSVGALISATGGAGGAGAGGGSIAPVTSGAGLGFGGAVNISGSPANSGIGLGSDRLGSAGGGAYSTSIVGGYSLSTGNTAGFPGGGGGGAGGSVAANGSTGANGYVIIEW